MLGQMPALWRRKRTNRGDDGFRDGRPFHPLDTKDGNPRIVITADLTRPRRDGSLPVHVDWFNMDAADVKQLLGVARDEFLMEEARQ